MLLRDLESVDTGDGLLTHTARCNYVQQGHRMVACRGPTLLMCVIMAVMNYNGPYQGNSLPERWCSGNPPMGSELAWPLPGESQRVRTLLYLSEGLILGAGSLLFSVLSLGGYLVDGKTGSFNPRLTAFGAFTFLLLLFFTLRPVAITKVRPQSQEKPLELQDWSETREW